MSASQRSRRQALRLSILALVAACSSTTEPLRHEGKPTALEFSLGGYGGPHTQFELRGDTVVAWRRPFDWMPGVGIDSVRVVPTAGEWRAFWDAADAAGIQSWREGYNAEGIVDGSSWHLHVVSDGREVNSSGSNAYPDSGGREHEGQQTGEFQAFTHALNVLAGAPSWF